MKGITYEPTKTSDFTFGDDSSEAIISTIMNGNLVFPKFGLTGLVLYGAFGTGKTCFSKVFCSEFEKSISGYDIQCPPTIFNCDKSTSIDSIMKKCNNTADLISYNHSDLHYFIFDEVDNMTNNAMCALKSFMNRDRVVCILTTNYLNKIDKGILDRCYKINFNSPPKKELIQRIQKIVALNGIEPLTEIEIDLCLPNNGGVWREILPVLSQTIERKQNN